MCASIAARLANKMKPSAISFSRPRARQRWGAPRVWPRSSLWKKHHGGGRGPGESAREITYVPWNSLCAFYTPSRDRRLYDDDDDELLSMLGTVSAPQLPPPPRDPLFFPCKLQCRTCFYLFFFLFK